MGMDETIVMWRYLNMIKLAKCRHFSSFGEAAKLGHVKLQDLYRVFLKQGTAAITGQFAFSSRQGDLRTLRQQLELAPVISPTQWFFEPAQMEWFDRRQACLEPFMAPS